jgi:hypothetical protein
VNIFEKLRNIQVALKAPKSNYNSFGKYNYRSIEDIQQAIKPHLEANKCTLIFTDNVYEVGGKIVIESTATLMDGGDQSASVTAHAQVDAIKGMNGAQAFGSASSYARKYAAGGLLLLDDTKDADNMNTHGKTKSPSSEPKSDDTLFNSVLERLTKFPTQENYDKAAVKFGTTFSDEQFKQLQGVVTLANKLQ